jgi:hypothetical protein
VAFSGPHNFALMRANGLGELLVALDGLPTGGNVPDLWPPASNEQLRNVRVYSGLV